MGQLRAGHRGRVDNRAASALVVPATPVETGTRKVCRHGMRRDESSASLSSPEGLRLQVEEESTSSCNIVGAKVSSHCTGSSGGGSDTGSGERSESQDLIFNFLSGAVGVVAQAMRCSAVDNGSFVGDIPGQ